VRARALCFVSILVLCAVAGCAVEQGAAGPQWWTEQQKAEQASPESIFGLAAATAWEFQGGSRKGEPCHVEPGAAPGGPALVCDDPRGVVIKGRTVLPAEVEVTCRVRLVQGAKSRFVIAPCKDPNDPKSKGLPLSLYASSDVLLSIGLPPLPGNRFILSKPELGGFTPSATPRSAQYLLRQYDKILPTWEPHVRAGLERDMARLPLVKDKWLLVRYAIGKDWVRIWVDNRLLLDHQSPELKTAGIMQMHLSPGTQLADVTVRPLAESDPLYEAVCLDGYVMDKDLAGTVGVHADALPFGRTVAVGGIPFAFADPALNGGADHLDVGGSLLRQANMQGHWPIRSEAYRFTSPLHLDPARIRLRVPNGRYDALYLIAGFDADEGSIPLVSAQFYRVNAGMSMIFEGEVPSIRAVQADARPLPVRLDDGSSARLWLVKVPLEPGMLSSFADMGWLDLELTKKTYQFRSYPDPIHYGWHGGGAPSGVHVYALTLHRPEVHMEVLPTVFGHVWEAAGPAYQVLLNNRTAEPQKLSLVIDTKSEDGSETTHQERPVTIAPQRVTPVNFNIPVKKNGYHEITVTMTCNGRTWTETRSLTKLAKNTRPDKWTGKGPLFGYWSYHGGHHTPPAVETASLMTTAGARASLTGFTQNPALKDIVQKYGARQGPHAWPISPQWEWAGEEPLDMAKYEAYKKAAVEAIRKVQGDNPPVVTFFPEPHISAKLTAGNLPSYWGEPEYKLDENEQRNVRVFLNTAKAAAEGVRAAWPNTKILIPWGDPLFVVPLLRAGFPKELIDGSGLDVPGFERLPEQQLHQISIHRLYTLREEFRKAGIENPYFMFVEGIFVPTEPGACTWDEQANYHDRWALICMGYGVNEFHSAWFAFDCGNYYGTEHYGGCGIQRRIPYCNPKPAYAHYATMTRMLDSVTFDKWLPTGSLSTYCVRLDKPKEKGGPVHVLWTLRGKRPVTLTLPQDATITVTDANDNTTPLKTKDKAVTVTTSPSVIYVHNAPQIESIALGVPDHSDSVEWARTRNRKTWQTGPLLRGPEVNYEQTIASLGDGTWAVDATRDDFFEIYETNNFCTARYPGKMAASSVEDPERGAALAVKLLKQDKEHKLMPWYTAIKPIRPVVIPGKSVALGLWVKAASDWGRVVYCLRDANDEMWLSIGGKDQWNCDDTHSWSRFNFDGWRYLRFELPSHTQYDSFREYGTTWWRYAGGKPEGIGVVDLPLRLQKVLVARRTHILYVNDVQPTGAEQKDVLLGDLVAEYESKSDAGRQAVAQNKVRMPVVESPKALANPIAEMAAANTLPTTKLKGVRDPDWGYDGTRCHVDFDPVKGATAYQVWVAAYKDGRGTVPMATMKQSGGLVQGLAPALKLYLWVTYTTETGEGKDKKVLTSKPSNRLTIQLVDAFGMK